MDPSVLANMDKDALKKQIENMKYQATMERWPLSKKQDLLDESLLSVPLPVLDWLDCAAGILLSLLIYDMCDLDLDRIRLRSIRS
ncbi:hypothetical protein KQX54_007819 [Cotesia glomerata]|uniref:Uncharacterized protein n=1 Tax=Cotesia glomerata TaxID=32391 RepID=A0AAV7HQ59_COTGL|nr:hypothetical protein KQX54_007819 [Cotesia glomerata]